MRIGMKFTGLFSTRMFDNNRTRMNVHAAVIAHILGKFCWISPNIKLIVPYYTIFHDPTDGNGTNNSFYLAAIAQWL